MNPDDTRPNAPIVVPPRQSGVVAGDRSTNSDQVADVVRSQIDAIYNNDPNATMAVVAEEAEPATSAVQPQPVAQPEASNDTAPVRTGAVKYIPDSQNIQYTHQQTESANPYERTHDEQQHQIQASAWQKYHSAWQSYYQQYYERYYVGQVHEAKKSLEAQAGAGHQDESISTDEAMYDLRTKLRGQISARAAKVRGSRHFMPAVAAGLVMLIFLFLQYNRVLISNVEAYVSPGNIDPAALIVDPNQTGDIGPEPKLIIPKIVVEVPIIWDAVASSKDSLNAAMDKGVAWFNINGANARPGEMGNFVLSGHSSNDYFDKGDYKFIFARLDQLNEGDTVYVNYNSTRYTYTITRKIVVKPTDVSALTNPVTEPEITLITCTPLGTDWNRLLVFGKQVSPDPKAAATTSSSTNSSDAKQMPKNSPTFLEKIFGIGN